MQIKRMNWVQKRPVYKVMEAWRQNRRAMIADFQSASQLALNNFATAQYRRTEGMAELAAKAALARTQEELKAFAKTLAVDRLA